MSFLKKLTKILSTIADIFIAGREMGLWSKKSTLPTAQSLVASPTTSVNFSWVTAVWKGIKVAAVMSAGIAVTSFLGNFDEVVEWTKLGTPQWIALGAVAGVEVLRNLTKQWYKAFKEIHE